VDECLLDRLVEKEENMQRHLAGLTPRNNHDDHDDRFDLNTLLHPAGAFTHPLEVVNDADLTLSEKRAILASWASDACAVEAAPALRRAPRSAPVKFDDIMDALRELDRQAQQSRHQPHYRRVLSQRRPGVFRRKHGPSDDRGQSLN
jgi:hypothetical protein